MGGWVGGTYRTRVEVADFLHLITHSFREGGASGYTGGWVGGWVDGTYRSGVEVAHFLHLVPHSFRGEGGKLEEGALGALPAQARDPPSAELVDTSAVLGGWVGGWVGWVEEEQVVGMRCCGLLRGGWVGGWVGGMYLSGTLEWARKATTGATYSGLRASTRSGGMTLAVILLPAMGAMVLT